MFWLGFLLKSEHASPEAVLATHTGFVISGVATTLLGPLLPALATKWSISDVQAGYLFTAQALGTLAGVTLCGPLTRRLGWLRGLVLGFAMMSAGLVALGFSSWFLGLAAVSLNGVALGVVLPTTNLLVAGVNPARRAESLNILNLLWGLGAMLGPAIVVPLTRVAGTAMPLTMLALLAASIAVWLLRLPALSEPEVYEEHGKRVEFASKSFRNWFVVLIALLAFLYVGSENAVGGWVALYAIRLDDSVGVLGAWTPAVFWAALLIGRATVPAALNFCAAERLVLAGLGLAAAGLSLLVSAHSLNTLLAGIILTGFGFGPVFPTTIASATRYLGSGATRVVNLVFGMGTLGSATLPWSVGFLSSYYGDLRAGLTVTVLSGLSLVALQVGCILLLSHSRSHIFSKQLAEEQNPA